MFGVSYIYIYFIVGLSFGQRFIRAAQFLGYFLAIEVVGCGHGKKRAARREGATKAKKRQGKSREGKAAVTETRQSRANNHEEVRITL